MPLDQPSAAIKMNGVGIASVILRCAPAVSAKQINFAVGRQFGGKSTIDGTRPTTEQPRRR